MTHKTKQAALEAARKTLGNDAIEGVDFVIKNTGAGYEHAEVPPANEAATKAQEKRGVKASAVEAPPKPKAGGAGKKPPRKPAAPASEAPKPKKTKAPKAAPAPKAEGPTKTDQLIAMMKRPGGATSAEMEAAVGWQPHSVRGLLGTLRQKKVPIISKKEGKEPTYYQIKAEEAPAPTGDVV